MQKKGTSWDIFFNFFRSSNYGLFFCIMQPQEKTNWICYFKNPNRTRVEYGKFYIFFVQKPLKQQHMETQFSSLQGLPYLTSRPIKLDLRSKKLLHKVCICKCLILVVGSWIKASSRDRELLEIPISYFSASFLLKKDQLILRVWDESFEDFWFKKAYKKQHIATKTWSPKGPVHFLHQGLWI